MTDWLKSRGADWCFSSLFGLALVSSSLGSTLVGVFTLTLCLWSFIWLALNLRSVGSFSSFEKGAAVVLITFFLAQQLSKYFVTDPDIIVSSGYAHYLILIIPLYMHSRQRVLTTSSIVNFGTIAIAVAFISSIWQVSFTGALRANMLFGGHEIMFGDFVLVSTMVTLAAMMPNAQNYKQKLAVTFVIGAGLLSVFLSGTRGAYVSVPLLLLLLIAGDRLINQKGQRTLSLKVLGMLCVLAVLVTSGFLASAKKVSYGDRIESMFEAFTVATNNGNGDSEPTEAMNMGDQNRLLMLAIGWELFLAKPLLGHGLGSYSVEKNKLAEENQTLQNYTTEDKKEFFKFNQPHNDYIRFLSEQGLIGFFFLLLLLFGPLWWLFNSLTHREQSDKQTYALCALVVAIAYIQFYMTEGVTSRSAMFSHQLVLLSVFISQVSRIKRQEKQK